MAPKQLRRKRQHRKASDEDEQETPLQRLMFAVADGDLPVMQELIAMGVDLDGTLPSPFSEAPELAITPLMAAASVGNTAAAELLLQHGANPNKTSAVGPALLLAGRRGHHDVVGLLLKHNAHPLTSVRDGDTSAVLIAGAYWELLEGLPACRSPPDVPKLLAIRRCFDLLLDAIAEELDRPRRKVPYTGGGSAGAPSTAAAAEPAPSAAPSAAAAGASAAVQAGGSDAGSQRPAGQTSHATTDSDSDTTAWDQNLLQCVRENNEVGVWQFLVRGANPNACLALPSDPAGRRHSALHHAVLLQNDQMVEELLRCGADPNLLTLGEPDSCVSPAAVQGTAHALTMLVACGGSLDSHRREPCRSLGVQWTPLQFAAAKRNYNAAAVLLAAGAQIQIDGKPMTSALWVAAAHADERFMRVSLATGRADPNVRDPDGQTPVFHLMKTAQGEPLVKARIVRLLLQAGADLSVVDKQRCTFLSYADVSEGIAVRRVLKQWEEESAKHPASAVPADEAARIAAELIAEEEAEKEKAAAKAKAKKQKGKGKAAGKGEAAAGDGQEGASGQKGASGHEGASGQEGASGRALAQRQGSDHAGPSGHGWPERQGQTTGQGRTTASQLVAALQQAAAAPGEATLLQATVSQQATALQQSTASQADVSPAATLHAGAPAHHLGAAQGVVIQRPSAPPRLHAVPLAMPFTAAAQARVAAPPAAAQPAQQLQLTSAPTPAVAAPAQSTLPTAAAYPGAAAAAHSATAPQPAALAAGALGMASGVQLRTPLPTTPAPTAMHPAARPPLGPATALSPYQPLGTPKPAQGAAVAAAVVPLAAAAPPAASAAASAVAHQSAAVASASSSNSRSGSSRTSRLGHCDDDDSCCVVCLDLPRETVLVPCGHVVLCAGCCEEVQEAKNECPMCRETIDAVLRLQL